MAKDFSIKNQQKLKQYLAKQEKNDTKTSNIKSKSDRRKP